MLTKYVDFTKQNRKIYSQNGEDGIIEAIFNAIGETNKFFVEIGTERGTECNTRWLLEKGWTGFMIDETHYPGTDVIACRVTKGSINKLLTALNVPQELDFLSIDVDSIDYYLWEVLTFKPRVVCIEYNASFPPTQQWRVDYNKDLKWDHNSNYFGASLLSLQLLGEEKGYTLVCCDETGTNAFFIRKDQIAEGVTYGSVEELFRRNNLWSKFE